MSPAVHVITEGIGADAMASVLQASGRLLRDVVQCRLDDVEGSGLGPVGAFVAALPLGERKVPKRLHRALSDRYPEVPLVLLSQEPLIQPTVWLDGGMVLLLTNSATERLISSRLRMLLGSPEAERPTSLRRKEVRTSRYWAATASNEGEVLSVERAFDWVGTIPDGAGGIAAPLDSETLSPADQGGVVKLSTTRGFWTIQWRHEWARPIIASARRAPHVSPIPVAVDYVNPAGGFTSTFRAASGDVLIARVGTAVCDFASPEWKEALLAGGAATLELIEGLASSSGASVRALIVEVL